MSFSSVPFLGATTMVGKKKFYGDKSGGIACQIFNCPAIVNILPPFFPSMGELGGCRTNYCDQVGTNGWVWLGGQTSRCGQVSMDRWLWAGGCTGWAWLAGRSQVNAEQVTSANWTCGQLSTPPAPCLLELPGTKHRARNHFVLLQCRNLRGKEICEASRSPPRTLTMVNPQPPRTTSPSSSSSSPPPPPRLEDVKIWMGWNQLYLNSNKREISAHLDVDSYRVLYLSPGRQNLTFSRSCCL